MKMERRVGPKGQVVIPHQIRRDFGIRPGTELEFDVEGNKIVLAPKSEEEILEMFERDSEKSGRKASDLLTGDELYEKLFGKS